MRFSGNGKKRGGKARRFRAGEIDVPVLHPEAIALEAYVMRDAVHFSSHGGFGASLFSRGRAWSFWDGTSCLNQSGMSVNVN